MFQFLRLFRRQGSNGTLRPVDPDQSSESASTNESECANGSDAGYEEESGSVDNYDPSVSVLYTDTASSWADTADIITQEEYEEGLERELQMHLEGEGEGERPTTEGGAENVLPEALPTEQEVQQDTVSPPDANPHYTEMDISNTQMARVLSAYRNRERNVLQGSRVGQGRRSEKVNGPGGNGATRSAGTSTPHRRKRHRTAPVQAPAPPPEMEALDCDALDEKWFRILKGFSRRSYRINGSFFHTAVRQWPGPTLRARPHSQH